jgi:hypothetical protein
MSVQIHSLSFDNRGRAFLQYGILCLVICLLHPKENVIMAYCISREVVRNLCLLNITVGVKFFCRSDRNYTKIFFSFEKVRIRGELKFRVQWPNETKTVHMISKNMFLTLVSLSTANKSPLLGAFSRRQ